MSLGKLSREIIDKTFLPSISGNKDEFFVWRIRWKWERGNGEYENISINWSEFGWLEKESPFTIQIEMQL